MHRFQLLQGRAADHQQRLNAHGGGRQSERAGQPAAPPARLRHAGRHRRPDGGAHSGPHAPQQRAQPAPAVSTAAEPSSQLIHGKTERPPGDSRRTCEPAGAAAQLPRTNKKSIQRATGANRHMPRHQIRVPAPPANTSLLSRPRAPARRRRRAPGSRGGKTHHSA